MCIRDSLTGRVQGHVRRGHQPDLFAHMIESQYLVEKQQAGIGHAQLILRQLRQFLDLAHRVIGKKAHRAGCEWRHSRQPCRLMPAQRFA